MSEFQEVSVEEEDYDLRSSEDIVADGSAVEDGEAVPPEEDQGDEGKKPEDKPAEEAETEDTPATDDTEGGDTGEKSEGTPALKPKTSQTPEYVKQRKIESLAYENRELKRRLKAVEAKYKESQPTEEDKKRERDYLEALRDIDPDKYQEELLRINNRDLKREVLENIESQQQPAIEDDVEATAASYRESLESVEQQIIGACPHAVNEDGQPNQAFWSGENGFWDGVKRAFTSEAQFLDAVQNNPGIISMIAENANANVERKLHSRQSAESSRKERISGQASSQAKGKATSEVPLTMAQKARCKQLGIKESDFAKYIPQKR